MNLPDFNYCLENRYALITLKDSFLKKKRTIDFINNINAVINLLLMILCFICRKLNFMKLALIEIGIKSPVKSEL